MFTWIDAHLGSLAVAVGTGYVILSAVASYLAVS
jgi:hypothetical protein